MRVQITHFWAEVIHLRAQMTKLCASKNVKFSKMLPLIPLELHTLQYTQERASIYQASRITAAQNIWCPQAATPVEMRNTEG